MTTYVKCPTCHKMVPWNQESKFRPFCSERCRLIDLGEWADEAHRIAGEEAFDEEYIESLSSKSDD